MPPRLLTRHLQCGQLSGRRDGRRRRRVISPPPRCACPAWNGECRITFTITCDGSLSYAEDSYNDGCDFAFSITEYGRMRLTRKEGQQVEVEGLLTQLSIGMTVFITADGEGPVTVEELNVSEM